MTCPDYPAHCRAPGSTQSHLTSGERDALTGRAAIFAREAEQCSYCGLVFVRVPTRRLGWFKGPVFEPAAGYT
jgi:hypothetical protein